MPMPYETPVEHFARVLRAIKYKDWVFTVESRTWKFEKINDTLYFLRVEFKTPNTETQDDASWKGRKWLLSERMTDSEIVQTAFKAVLTAEEHETREQFKYHGQAVLAPHHNLNEVAAMMAHGQLSSDIRKD